MTSALNETAEPQPVAPSWAVAVASAPESEPPLSGLFPELLPGLPSIAEPPLDEPDPAPDPPPDEEVEEDEGDEDDVPLGAPLPEAPRELPPPELGPALEPFPLPDPPVEDAEVATIAPPASAEMPLTPVVPTFPPQAAPPSWPKAVTTTQAMID